MCPTDFCPLWWGKLSFQRSLPELATRGRELGEGELEARCLGETFLKVMMHSMSSPANILEVSHWTDTLISDMTWTLRLEGLSPRRRDSWSQPGDVGAGLFD